MLSCHLLWDGGSSPNKCWNMLRRTSFFLNQFVFRTLIKSVMEASISDLHPIQPHAPWTLGQNHASEKKTIGTLQYFGRWTSLELVELTWGFVQLCDRSYSSKIKLYGCYLIHGTNINPLIWHVERISTANTSHTGSGSPDTRSVIERCRDLNPTRW